MIQLVQSDFQQVDFRLGRCVEDDRVPDLLLDRFQDTSRGPAMEFTNVPSERREVLCVVMWKNPPRAVGWRRQERARSDCDSTLDLIPIFLMLNIVLNFFARKDAPVEDCWIYESKKE